MSFFSRNTRRSMTAETTVKRRALRWFAYPGNLMAAKIVGNHDVAGRQAWSELLFDVGEEQLAIDRAVEQARRDDAIAPQASDEGGCHPMPEWHAADHPLAAWRRAIAARHICRHPAFIDEDQLAGIECRLSVAPSLSRRRNIGPACSAACVVLPQTRDRQKRGGSPVTGYKFGPLVEVGGAQCVG